MRNYPEFLISFWAIHLLGGVATLINAWSPAPVLIHCIALTNPKILIVDPERADRLSGSALEELQKKTNVYKVFVVRSRSHARVASQSGVVGGGAGRAKWKGIITPLEDALEAFQNADSEPWSSDPSLICAPDDNATIFFTSGTTGLPKGVLSSQRGFLTNVLNSFVAKARATLRKGEDIPTTISKDEPQKGVLISVPLFHVTGLTSAAVGILQGGVGKLEMLSGRFFVDVYDGSRRQDCLHAQMG